MTFDAGSTEAVHIGAGADLTAKQYYAIKQSAGAADVAVDGDVVWGVLQDAPASGAGASVVLSGLTKVAITATVTADELIGPLADGTFGPASGTPVARACESGTTGQNILAYLDTSLQTRGKTSNQAITLAAAATEIVANSRFCTITGDAGANTVATITGAAAEEGSILHLLFVDGLVTITDTDAHTADTVDLVGIATNFVSADDSILSLIFDGTSWYEIGRSVN